MSRWDPANAEEATAPDAASSTLAFLGIGRVWGTLSGQVTELDATAHAVLGLEDHETLAQIDAFGVPGPSPLQSVIDAGEVHEMSCWLALSSGRRAFVVLSGRLVRRPGDEALVQWFVRRGVSQPVVDQPYRAIFDQVDDGIAVHDIDSGRIVDANRAASSMFGIGREQALLVEPHDVTTGESDAADKAAFERIQAAARGERQVFEWEAHDASGRPFWLEVSLRKAKIGGVDRIVAVMRDVTQRRREDALHLETAERLRTILNTTHEIVWTLDLDGCFTFVNTQGEDATGYSAPEWIGLPFDPLIHPDDREMVRDAFRKTIAGERTRFNAQVLDVSGRTRSLLVNTAPLVQEGRVIGMVGLGNDVTEQVRLEEELNKAQKIESLGLLAGGIAHDFNNILTAIVGGISLARRRAGSDSSLLEMLSLSETACMRARDLTQQLLTFSRGGAPICKPASMAELIRETAHFVSRGSKVRCELDIDPSLSLVDMDASQMSQVLGNLILNGIQAMPDGGTITIEAHNEEIGTALPPGSALRPGRHVCVSVRDSGVGIRPEHVAKIFDPYFTTKPGGSGLGLATSYSIVRRHKGHIDFESTPGVGTTFRIRLPAAARSVAPAPSAPASASATRAPVRVLLVDDEPVLRDVASLMLRTLGYGAETAASGEQAVDVFRDAARHGTGFDVVVMDLTMPGGMSGREAAGALRSLDPKVVIVASSGYSTDPVMADPGSFGFDGAVPKPYIASDLDEALRAALKKRDR